MGRKKKLTERASEREGAVDEAAEIEARKLGFPAFDRKDIGKRVIWTLKLPVEERWRFSSLWRKEERKFAMRLERRRMADERRFFPIGGETACEEDIIEEGNLEDPDGF